MPLGSQTHVYLTQQKITEYLQLCLSCSCLRWKIQLWTFGWQLWHTAQFWTTSTIHTPKWKQLQLHVSVLKPPLSPWTELPNPNLQEMSNKGSPFCDFWWCFHNARTISGKMVSFWVLKYFKYYLKRNYLQNCVSGISEVTMTTDSLANFQPELKFRHLSLT